jgi:thiamine biosynthesis lipoprotein
MLSPCAERRRCRPLLGTLVEIGAAGADPARLDGIIAAAFREVERVHACMSFHAADSDVSRLNRAAWRDPVEVDERTIEVLTLAREVFTRSGGMFEIAIAPVLAELGVLPGKDVAVEAEGSSADIELLGGRRVRFRRPLAIDLGGIAKGYAVDRAVECLRALGAEAGRVNAGGDLRVFGPPQPVQVRHPAHPWAVLPLTELADGAIATTGGYFSRGGCAPVVDPRTRTLAPSAGSVSVRADGCALADALAKVVWLLREDAAPVLASYGARAWVICDEDEPCETTASA